MGFLSDLFDLTPHMTIGQKAMNYCVNFSINEKEHQICNQFGISTSEYTKVRNVCNISVFIALFQHFDSNLPNTRYGITYIHFQQLYWDYYHNSGEQTGYALWQDQLESFCKRVTGKERGDLDRADQEKLREIVDIYQSGAISFFKTNSKKLSEIIA